MTERERRAGSGGTEDNVRDEFDEATGHNRRKDAPKEDDQTEGGGSGGVKDNVEDEWDESQRR